MIRAALILLAALALPAQGPTTQAPRPAAPTEESIIERFRAHAAPRPVAPAAPLSAEERNTIRRFKEIKPSVVFVSAYVQLSNDSDKIPAGSGTGFVWDEWGHIVTNHHVISKEVNGKLLADAKEVEITLAGGKTYKGRVIGASFAYDIAVIQAFAPLDALRPIPIGASGGLQVGQSVLAVGNPFGLDHSLSRGVISALGREIATGYSTWILNSIQTDAAINPGNSGGPLLDSGGRLIGMNTAIAATRGEGSVGVGFAIPVDTLNGVVPRLIARGFLHPPSMGFDSWPSAITQQTFGLRGILIGKVTPGTPAARAGLRAMELDDSGRVRVMGDVLLGYQGRAIESEGQFMAMLELEPPADEIVFDVLRDGKMIKVTLRFTEEDARPASI
ncbi:S1C family serine protease [Geothrix sp. 21YS21S-4]|uniref:S1C family serine protease n=1 Tax=Geothrix sp. 21YS21S-4 TaxID=3068889 RepID=UPI0027B87E8F|nr:trypsin-like peptidase domain-containing protein [Geothrix sp. 21YS21S-4]